MMVRMSTPTLPDPPPRPARRSWRRPLLRVAGWLLATVVAVGLGIFATGLIGRGLAPGAIQPLDQDRVGPALASANARTGGTATGRPADPTAPSPSPASSAGAGSSGRPPASGTAVRTIRSPGGSVVARCAGDRVELLRWTAAQGFGVDDNLRSGPSTEARIKFESDEQEYRIRVRCEAGVPVGAVTADD